MDVALGTNYAQDFDLNVALDSVDVDDIAPPTIKLSDLKSHAPLLSSFSLENSLYFGVNEMISFQKVVGNSDKMTVANLGRQPTKIVGLLFQEFFRIIYTCLELKFYYFTPPTLHKLVVYIVKLIFTHVFVSPQVIRHLYAICHSNENTTPRSYNFLIFLILVGCVSQTCHAKEGKHAVCPKTSPDTTCSIKGSRNSMVLVTNKQPTNFFINK